MKDAGLGFPDNAGFGILLDGADDNLVQRNAVIGGTGPAIFVTSLESQGTSDRNVISHNQANSGSATASSSTATRRRRCSSAIRADGNGDDGIEVDADGNDAHPQQRQPQSRSRHRGGARPIDGGGNRARGNGNPLQCTNVICS